MNSPTSLLGLPAEIRNKIYYELLASSPPNEDSTFHLSKHSMSPAILYANRQLRSECSGIFYANTCLQFQDLNVCILRFTNLDPCLQNLIPELRYDTAAVASAAPTWRTMLFGVSPSQDRDMKMKCLREELERKGIRLRPGVLKAKTVVTFDSGEQKENPWLTFMKAVKDGITLARIGFM